MRSLTKKSDWESYECFSDVILAWSWMGKCNAIGTWFEEKWEIDLANEEP